MAMFSGYATQEEKDATMFGLANVAVTGLYQQSFLQGLKTLMDAVTNDNEDGSRKVGWFRTGCRLKPRSVAC